MEEQTTDTAPTLSVVVASKVGPPFIDQCLRSIEAETRELSAEVIVVAAGAKEYAERIQTQFPWCRVVHSPDVSKVPALRRIGAQEAGGELVAVIEEHCTAAPDWLHKALGAHAKGEYAAVGGPVADHDYDRLRDWVVYFCEYNGSMPPFPDGESEHLNDANIVYRRDVLLRHADRLDDGFWPMAVHPVMLAEGARFRSVPEMVVHHRGPFDFAYYLHQRFLFSRAFAGVRAQNESALWRLTYLVAAPLIAVMLLFRMALTVWRKQGPMGAFVRTLPLTVVAIVVLVAGEWVGCLLGPGDALSEVE